MSHFLSTATGGGVLASRIEAMEPALDRENKWAIVATTMSGATIQLAPRFHDREMAHEECMRYMEDLWRG